MPRGIVERHIWEPMLVGHDPKTENWLASRRRGDLERLRKEEQEIADLWWASLSLEQREIFSELLESHDGLTYLSNKIMKARIQARLRRDKNE